MSRRSLTALFSALAAIAITAAIAMAATRAGPKAHASVAVVQIYHYNSIGRFMTAGTHVQTVNCARGKKLTGGGVRLYGTGGLVESSSPTDDLDGWRAAVRVSPAPFIDMQVKVYAICAEIF
jgi:hypothetical protein